MYYYIWWHHEIAIVINKTFFVCFWFSFCCGIKYQSKARTIFLVLLHFIKIQTHMRKKMANRLTDFVNLGQLRLTQLNRTEIFVRIKAIWPHFVDSFSQSQNFYKGVLRSLQLSFAIFSMKNIKNMLPQTM